MSKNHDAIPIPNVQVFARSVGKIKFTCPNCSHEHALQFVHWRRGDIQCIQCKAKFQLGLGFDELRLAFAYLMGKWQSYTVNRIRPVGTQIFGTQLQGSVEYCCPNCQTPQKEYLAYDQTLTCQRCHIKHFISVLVYRLPKVSRLKVKAPFDSVVKGIEDALKITIDTALAPSSDQISGANSNGSGGNS